MKILIVCGFLGSGKTTLIRALVEELRQRTDRPIAIIENEAGREGLDARLLAQPQIYVTEIYGGCLCCQYSGNLLPAVESIQANYAPEWLIVELTGLALLPGVLEVFRSVRRPWELASVCIADASRWDRLRLATGELLFEQAREADVIILNKADVAPDTQTAEAELSGRFPQSSLWKASLREGMPAGLLEKLWPE